MFSVTTKRKDGTTVSVTCADVGSALCAYDRSCAEFSPELDTSVCLAQKVADGIEILKYRNRGFAWSV